MLNAADAKQHHLTFNIKHSTFLVLLTPQTPTPATTPPAPPRLHPPHIDANPLPHRCHTAPAAWPPSAATRRCATASPAAPTTSPTPRRRRRASRTRRRGSR